MLLSASIAANAQWTQQVTNTDADFTAVHFPTPSIGYISGDFNGYGGYLKTTDGGNTWTSELITFAPFQSIHFANADTGTAIGYGVYFRTTDGGATWNNPAPPENYMQNVWNFTGNKLLVSSGSNIHWSTNGGNSWTMQVDTVMYEGFHFLDNVNGYTVGWDGTFAYRGMIGKTTDQGATWTYKYLQNYTQLSEVHFPSTNVGYAVGQNRVVKTSDAGNTWSLLPVDSMNYYYSDVFFTSNTTGHVVGQNSVGNPIVMSTNDGGNTWATTTLGTGIRNLNSVWCSDANTCFAVGDSGTVYKTTNAGGMSVNDIYNSRNVNAYPNPFNESLVISIDGNSLDNGSFYIYDVFGREVKMMNALKGNEITVSRDDLAPGVYFYMLREGERPVASGKITAQ